MLRVLDASWIPAFAGMTAPQVATMKVLSAFVVDRSSRRKKPTTNAEGALIVATHACRPQESR
ncbi:MAG: hypothetical protein L0387_21830 [Acidobacteria bacterium]|nr:hypothetical protein [Acidobacteriota bacterium]